MALPGSPRLRRLLSQFQLRRIITSNKFIPEVDGFRFVAILIVILSHLYVQDVVVAGPGLFSKMFALAFVDGQRGVLLFFAISGFILALPFARHHLQGGNRVDLKSYLKRRITRLEPPYLLAMLFRLVLIVLTHKHAADLSLGLHFLASIFYVHSLAFDQYSIINPPAWSLEVEIQFYLLAPLLTAIFILSNKALRRSILVGCMLLGGAASLWLVQPMSRTSLTLLNYSQYFLAGFLLCDLYLTSDRPRLPAWLLDVSGVAALLWILYSRASWYPVAMPFATLVLYLAGFYGTAVRRFFALRTVSLIGGMCYSLYLTHTTVLTGMSEVASSFARSRVAAGAQTAMMFGLSFAAILGLGIVFFVLIERPCMDPAWPHKLAVKLRRR